MRDWIYLSQKSDNEAPSRILPYVILRLLDRHTVGDGGRTETEQPPDRLVFRNYLIPVTSLVTIYML